MPHVQVRLQTPDITTGTWRTPQDAYLALMRGDTLSMRTPKQPTLPDGLGHVVLVGDHIVDKGYRACTMPEGSVALVFLPHAGHTNVARVVRTHGVTEAEVVATLRA